MSHGIRRKARKLQKFLDNGGTILKLKFKGKLNDWLDQRFYTIDQDKKPFIQMDYFRSGIYGKGSMYSAPCLAI